MKVYYTSTGGKNAQQVEEIKNHISYCEACVEASGSAYQVARSPHDADIIVFIEPPYHKFREYAHTLLGEELIQRYPNRCFVIEYTDKSDGFLPGIYVGIARGQADYNRFRSGCYVGTPHPMSTESARQRDNVRPDLLMSFRGFASSKVRGTILDAAYQRSDISIVENSNFGIWTQTNEARRTYFSEMLRSKFVLCPRGSGLTSVRLFETMESGRAPVILADDWWPPEGPAWSEFSLMVSESKAPDLATILSAYAADAAEMGRLARKAWEEWFSQEVRAVRMLEAIEDIIMYRPAGHDEAAYQRDWLSWTFAWRNEWTIPQKAWAAPRKAVRRARSDLLYRTSGRRRYAF